MKKISLSIFFLLFVSLGFCQTAEEKIALQLYNDEKRPEAIAAFEKILAAKPTDINAIDFLGRLYHEIGKEKEAYNMCSKGLLLYKDDISLCITKAKAAINLDKAAEAEALMDKCIAKEPNLNLLYSIKGNALDAQNKIQLAIAMYTKSIQLDPGVGINYLNRGNDFAAISRFPQAVADYDKLLNIYPESNEGYNQRGMAKYNLGKLDEAISDYTKAIQLKNYYALPNRGVAYLDQSKTELARADFKQAIAIAPKVLHDAYSQLAMLQFSELNYEEALLNINAAIALQPKYASYVTLSAKIFLGLQKHNEALQAADKALKINPQYTDAYIFKSVALSNLKRFDEAIATINEGIKLNPNNYIMYATRAFFYKNQGKTALADADNAKAKELGAKN